VTRLDSQSRIPEPGWMFRITALHTCETETPWLTGTWHRAGTQPADPACALWLILAEQTGGQVSVGLLADHEHTPGRFVPLARYTGLHPAAWTSAIAPALAAHPYTAHLHHPAPRKTRDRAARTILAYLMTSR
jgi:hypothetical protein